MIKKIRKRKARPSLLVFVGALVVFLTYVLKEGVAENYKNSVAVLEETQNVFGLREEVKHLRALILDAAGAAVSKRTAVIQNVTWENEGHQFVDDDLEAMSQFLTRIGANRELWNRLDVFKRDLLEQQRSDRELLDELNGTNGRQQKTIDEIEAGLIAQVPINRRIDHEYRQLKADLITTAREQRDRQEHYYEISKWAAMVFYTIGWGLGLVGKVYDIYGVEGTG